MRRLVPLPKTADWLIKRQVWYLQRLLLSVHGAAAHAPRVLMGTPQVRGFQGRPCKDEDTCYSFWIGAALMMLDYHHVIDGPSLLSFLALCESDKYGGFSKVPGASTCVVAPLGVEAANACCAPVTSLLMP